MGSGRRGLHPSARGILASCVFVILVALTSGCGQSERLQGAWQSDADKTLADIARVNPQLAEDYGGADLFGWFRLEFDGNRVRAYDVRWAMDEGGAPLGCHIVC